MIKAINFTAKDKVNALAGANSLKDYAGNTVRVTGAALDSAVDVETGETKTVAYLATADGVISTISKTACESISAIIDFMTEENSAVVDVAVTARKSHAGREFITLSLV